MGMRRKARECALQILYQLEIGGSAVVSMNEYWRQFEGETDKDIRDFSMMLAEGAWEKKDEIDTMIAEYSTNWKINRMASVDKNILRMAIYELLFCDDIPVKVTLNEAVEIAKKFGTAESSAFVNGILDNVAREKAKNKFKVATGGE